MTESTTQPTQSQLDALTSILSEEEPARAEVRMLTDGTLVVEAYSYALDAWPESAVALGRRAGISRGVRRTEEDPIVGDGEPDPPTSYRDRVRWVRGEEIVVDKEALDGDDD